MQSILGKYKGDLDQILPLMRTQSSEYITLLNFRFIHIHVNVFQIRILQE